LRKLPCDFLLSGEERRPFEHRLLVGETIHHYFWANINLRYFCFRIDNDRFTNSLDRRLACRCQTLIRR
jgi:hypothetical protein